MSSNEIVSNLNDGTFESGTVFNMSFQPQNEEQLIGFAKWLKSREHHSIIKAKWTLGSKINESGDAVYGEDTAGLLKRSAIPRARLIKAVNLPGCIPQSKFQLC